MNLTLEAKKFLKRRLFSRTKKTKSCWIWQGTTTRGYGMVSWKYYRGSTHRLSLLLVGRSVPRGLTVDHLCRVRNCLNPSHLEVVTTKENILRGESWAAKNSQKTHCKNGHEFTPKNTRWMPKGRQCWICCRARSLKWKRKVGYHSTLWKQGKRFYANNPGVAVETGRKWAR